jgi:hypothetical protein
LADHPLEIEHARYVKFRHSPLQRHPMAECIPLGYCTRFHLFQL